ECLGRNHKVQPDGPLIDVEHIHLDFLFIRGCLASHYLPKPGQTRLHGEKLRQEFAIPRTRVWSNGPGADEGQLPRQNTEELRKLVKAVLAQKLANPQDTGIVFQLE